MRISSLVVGVPALLVASPLKLLPLLIVPTLDVLANEERGLVVKLLLANVVRADSVASSLYRSHRV